MVARSDSQQKLESFLGIVLAGGKSSRMGEDKALLNIQNKTLLEYQYEKLISILGKQNVLVSGKYPSFKYLMDQKTELGPLGGIISVVQNFSKLNYFLFLPVDMPNISVQTLNYLIQKSQENLESNCWTFKNYEMPLVLKNHSLLEATLVKLLEQPKSFCSVRRLCQSLDYQVIETDEFNKNEFLNANTMKEWKKACQ
ncbi:MAG: molybdenum cofactor guanylyltransferase [Pseudobdellovibrio sp.]